MKEHFSRRTFLKTSIATAPAAVLIGSRAVQAETDDTKNDQPLRLGLMTYNLARDWDMETVIKNLTETKWEHVQLRTTHAHGVEGRPQGRFLPRPFFSHP